MGNSAVIDCEDLTKIGPEDIWIHRSLSMRCKTCMYFVKKGNYLGRCRRRSPALGGWPVVTVKDWCGDHKLDSEDKLFKEVNFGESN